MIIKFLHSELNTRSPLAVSDVIEDLARREGITDLTILALKLLTALVELESNLDDCKENK